MVYNFLGIDEKTKKNLLTFNQNICAVYSNIRAVYPNIHAVYPNKKPCDYPPYILIKVQTVCKGYQLKTSPCKQGKGLNFCQKCFLIQNIIYSSLLKLCTCCPVAVAVLSLPHGAMG